MRHYVGVWSLLFVLCSVGAMEKPKGAVKKSKSEPMIVIVEDSSGGTKGAVKKSKSDPVIVTVEDPLGIKRVLSDDMLSDLDPELKKKILREIFEQHGISQSCFGKEKRKVIPKETLADLIKQYREVADNLTINYKGDNHEKEEPQVTFEFRRVSFLKMISKLYWKQVKKLRQLFIDSCCSADQIEDV